jgi:hypothetical protein
MVSERDGGWSWVVVVVLMVVCVRTSARTCVIIDGVDGDDSCRVSAAKAESGWPIVYLVDCSVDVLVGKGAVPAEVKCASR